ncbi:hypothetical protein [Nonomuraea sp. JJY05]|jgi:hypothetical protein|uniref:hypothetical protein n=1 Tax=Nonomuraea sp. JJY05 TaxID=3350255 RepID=UPI00373E386F
MLQAWHGALAVAFGAVITLTGTPAPQAIPAKAAAAGCAAFVVGQAEEVVSDATRDRLGLDGRSARFPVAREVRQPFTRYVKAGHHLVITGRPPSGYAPPKAA